MLEFFKCKCCGSHDVGPDLRTDIDMLRPEHTIKTFLISEYQKENHECLIQIKKDSNSIVLFNEKKESFLRAMSELGFKWNSSVWERKLKNPEEQTNLLVWLIHTLLNLGYKIDVTHIHNFDYDSISKRVREGDFSIDIKNTIDIFEINSFIALMSPADNAYAEFKSLKGTKWNSARNGLVLPIALYDDILKLAELHNFKMTDNAKKQMAFLLGGKNVIEKELMV